MRQEGQSTAQNRPVIRVREQANTADMATRAIPPIQIPNDGPIEREREEIVMVDKPMSTEYQSELAFMEEPVTIVLARSSEKFAPAILDFYVNGKAAWIRVGRPVTLPRKYVEVIARTQPYDVRTTVVKHEDHEDNKIERQTLTKYPFSVISGCESAKAQAWLQRVMLES